MIYLYAKNRIGSRVSSVLKSPKELHLCNRAGKELAFVLSASICVFINWFSPSLYMYIYTLYVGKTKKGKMRSTRRRKSRRDLYEDILGDRSACIVVGARIADEFRLKTPADRIPPCTLPGRFGLFFSFFFLLNLNEITWFEKCAFNVFGRNALVF